MGTPEQHKRLTLLVKLLRQVTSQEVVSQFLERHGTPHSIPSWDSLLETRLQPALGSKKIEERELYDLLADAEEHGRKHVFLYKAGQQVMDQLGDVGRARRFAGTHGLPLGSTNLQDLPDKPTVCCVRADGQEVVVKLVEKRRYKKFLDEDVKNDVLTKRWRFTEERAVNLARLRLRDGLLEVRIHSRKDTEKYAEALGEFWEVLKGLWSRSAFNTLSLQKAKDRVYKNRNTLKAEIRYSDSVLKNENGTTVSAATGDDQQNLFDDEAAGASVDAFMSRNGHCSKTNVWWIKQKNGVPDRDIHVLLAGEPNEFAIPANCTKAEHDYVLGRLLSHGR